MGNLILSAIERYGGVHSIFDEAIAIIMKYIALNINQNLYGDFIADERLCKLKVFMIKAICEAKFFFTTIQKYECVKNYCIKNCQQDGEHNDEPEAWQVMFKEYFMDSVEWTKMAHTYLLQTMRNDDIFSRDEMMELLIKKSDHGYDIRQVLLNAEERNALKVGDEVDIRWPISQAVFREGMVISKDANEITIREYYTGFEEALMVDDFEYLLARHKSVTKEEYACMRNLRPCLQSVKVGSYLHVNFGYDPQNRGRKNQWLKSVLKNKRFGHLFEFDDPEANVNGSFYVHAFSVREVACFNYGCNYCFR